MKKRLYWILFTSFTGFFALIAILFKGSFNLNLNESLSEIFSLVTIVLIVNFALAEILSKYILKETSIPFVNFINYIKNTFLNHSKKEENITENESSIKDLVDYGIKVEDLEQSVENLLKNQEARREFSANVSHELKSPLTSIIGYAELISQNIATGEEVIEFSSRINQEGQKLLKMIDEIIQISKIDNDYIKKDSVTKFDLGKVIVENIDSLSMYAKENKVKIYYNYKEIEYLGNQNLISDLVRNLISNAIKYSKKEGGELTIEVKDRIDKLKLYFTDNGIGISKEDQERIFERFYVVNKSRGAKSGTGLGLSLVKNIVKFHKGSIKIDSELGVGSRFVVTLLRLENEDF